MQIARINENGLQQIADALGEHHKMGRGHFTITMLHAWAREAEDHFNEGSGCYIQIRGMDSVSGWPVDVDITKDGYDLLPIAS